MHVREQEQINNARCNAVCYVIISKLAHIYAHAMTIFITLFVIEIFWCGNKYRLGNPNTYNVFVIVK